jgi:alpha-N-acetylglucosaminidase
VFGEVKYFAADLFHEGTVTPGVEVTAAATNVQQAMLRATPEAIWVIQGWFSNPKAELLAGLDRTHALILDLWGDENPLFPSYTGRDVPPFDGVPWIWSILQNFGGRTALHGNLDTVTELYADAGLFDDPSRGALTGLGVLMEATHQNPVVLDLVSEMIWRAPTAGALDLQEWVRRYADRRYGKALEATRSAWLSLLETAYSTTPGLQFGPNESIICARPDLAAKNVYATGPPADPYYDMPRLEAALGDLLAARDELGAEDTYRYDLVDVTRQVVANRARLLLDDVRAAYEAEDRALFVQLGDGFLELIRDQDRLVGTRQELLLGAWIQGARAMGATGAEADRFEAEARRLLTSWSEEESILRDYAHREWAGLLGDYYHGRWKLYFDYLTKQLDGGSADPPDFFAYESAWTEETDPDGASYASASVGDSIAVAQELYERYAAR